LDSEEVEELARRYAAHLEPHIGAEKDIPAPDVNTNPQIIDWMVDELSKTQGDLAKAALTGKSIAAGGSEGRTAATGRGGVIALVRLLEHLGSADKPFTVALQGFGNVGYYFADVLRNYPNLKLVAIANSKVTVVLERGLAVHRHKGSAEPKLEQLDDFAAAHHLSPGAIFRVDADILVLAALENAITLDNVNDVKAGIVIELANGPISAEAHDLLTARGTLVLPDIIANAGGVIVSYLEWQQNLKNQHWTEAAVNARLEEYMDRAMQAMLVRYTARKTTLKAASFEYALQRLMGEI
jgi:glutamate dehydrogenase/leucine dehydrogenase